MIDTRPVHSTRRARLLVAGVGTAALLGLAACGGDGDGNDRGGGGADAVSASEVEDRISSDLEEQVGQEPDEVSCPDDLEAEEGATLECTLTAGTDELGVTVTVQSVEGDTVNYAFEVDQQVQ